MTELHITPQLASYPKIANDVFLMLLDGKLRSRTETLKFMKPLAPPPPPPPPPPPVKPRRGKPPPAAPAPPPPPATPLNPRAKRKRKAGIEDPKGRKTKVRQRKMGHSAAYR